MQVMDYASHKIANVNSDNRPWYLPIAPLDDSDWSLAVRGVQCYEKKVSEYFGEKVDRGLWLGDKYLMYGTDSPLELGGRYLGVRRRNQLPSGWCVTSLCDRNEEGSGGIDQTSSFDLAWKYVMRNCVLDHFIDSELWVGLGRRSFFGNKIVQNSSYVQVCADGSLNPHVDNFSQGNEWWEAYREILMKGDLEKLSPGPGFVFFSTDNPRDWYKNVWLDSSDLSWGFDLDIEDYISLLFTVGNVKSLDKIDGLI
ncbi:MULTISPECIES: hypothetical protein [unclassified Corynebacterium]|uniref:hypothetical protein n=1 Tax=unclassified Corynebacterium TaxID=2624378 RepID=UPI00128C4AE3|nr:MULTISPECIES: hypothetical protein [unclassified Corynebacterium]